MKKILSMVLALLLTFSVMPGGINLTASAARTGKTGDCTWTLNGTELTISGNGRMGDYEWTYSFNNDYISYITSAPWGTYITKVIIKNSVTSIGDYAFKGCSRLSSVTIGNSVTSIGDNAFDECGRLTSITIPDSVTSIGDFAFCLCYGLTSVTIPDSVTSIGNGVFSYTKFTSVTIPNSVTSIGDSAFYPCTSLTSITIPDSVISIGEDAFRDCTSLTSITIPDSVTSIGEKAFYNTAYYDNLNNWENGILYIGNHLIEAKNTVTSCNIKQGTKTIGDCAFSCCFELTNVTIPNSVTSIGSYAFVASGLTSITIPDSVTSIGDGAFMDCESLTSITIPDSVTSIGEKVFYRCHGITSVIIGNRVTSIGKESFYGCLGLTSVTIPNSVTYIGDYAFDDCPELKNVTILNSLTYMGDRAFPNCKGLISIKKVKVTVKDQTYNGKTLKPSAVVKLGNYTLKYGVHYTVTYKNNKNVGKATITITGKGAYKDSVTTTFQINIAPISQCKVKLSSNSYTYNGDIKTPSVTIKNSVGKTLKNKNDYTVTYASGRTKVGMYKVTVKMKGNYSGTKTLNFTINPKKTSVSKVTAGKKSLKVSIKKQTKEVTGYEIQYSTSKKFKSAKKVTIKKAKTTSTTIKKLKAKKTYYVRVRTYKTVNGKKYYSGWSSAKSKKTK